MNFQNKLLFNGFLVFCLTFNNFSEGSGTHSNEVSELNTDTKPIESNTVAKPSETNSKKSKSANKEKVKNLKNVYFNVRDDETKIFEKKPATPWYTKTKNNVKPKFFVAKDDGTFDFEDYRLYQQNDREQEIIAQMEDLKITESITDEETNDDAKRFSGLKKSKSMLLKS